MKLLLDQNISYKVPQLLNNAFDHTAQVKQLGLENATDSEIWRFAKNQGYTIVTFDSDFIDLVQMKGTPPKVIWLKFGNASNLKLANKLILAADAIKVFIHDDASYSSFLIIN